MGFGWRHAVPELASGFFLDELSVLVVPDIIDSVGISCGRIFSVDEEHTLVRGFVSLTGSHFETGLLISAGASQAEGEGAIPHTIPHKVPQIKATMGKIK